MEILILVSSHLFCGFEFNNLEFSEPPALNNLSEFNNFFEALNGNERHLAVQPNHEKTVQPNFEMPGSPNPPTNKKIYLNNLEYNLLHRHVEYFDQQVGAGHSIWWNKDFKIMKISTIILMGMIILALKVLALFTLSLQWFFY